MEELNAARYNVYWFLSFIVPAAVMLVATYPRRKPILWAGVVVSVIATNMLCNLAVQEKWRTRQAIAKTEQQRQAAFADGANLVFTAYLFAPFESVLYTSLWGVLGWRVWPGMKRPPIEPATPVD